MKESKQYNIPKRAVAEAYRRVKQNKGSAGVDGEDFGQFEENLRGNLYRIWNRMSSGSYFPPAVMAVEIPKKTGGIRRLGIPTIKDRVAQMVARMYVEAAVEPIFCEESYGYRPKKSAIDAVRKARQLCWRYDYVIDLDIKGLFDHIDHELLMRAVEKHVKEPWVKLYIQRWLSAPFVTKEGEQIERTAGTPQGGVISPVLANLFMHYALDLWMKRNYPAAPFERYADDVVIHCHTRKEAAKILQCLGERMKECKLELHPEKTKIVYCKDEDRRRNEPVTEFDFLGYTFRSRYIWCRDGKMRENFISMVSKKAAKSFRDQIKAMEIHKRSGSTLSMIAEIINPKVRGWTNYFGMFCPSAMKDTLQCINNRIIKWAMCKYKRFRGRRRRAEEWLRAVRQREPSLFVHWKYRYC